MRPRNTKLKVQKDLGQEGVICASVNGDFLTSFLADLHPDTGHPI